ncbi:MAG TPA: nuclear transport factor 2 family protein [Paraburkholderia sp.]|jgi:hypothetical protein
MNDVSLPIRVARLEAESAIRALKARYAALADAKYTSDYQRVAPAEMQRLALAQAMCFTEDAVWAGGSGFGDDLRGRAELVDWFGRSPWCFAVHYYGSPLIEIDGDAARADWRLWQLAMRADTREAVLLAAVTHERYARQHDGAWLCSHMRFAGLHMTNVGAQGDALAATFAGLDRLRSNPPLTENHA